MQHIRVSSVGKTACAVVLSCLLAVSPLVDGASYYAFAEEKVADSTASESAPVDEASPEEKPQKHEQLNEDKPLVPEAAQTPSAAEKAPAEEEERDSSPASENKPSSDEPSANAPAAATVVDPNRVGVDVPLTKGEDVVATAGTVIVDGLNYVVNPDGGTATVAGSVDGAEPKGDVIVAATVVSGSDEYLVTAIADEAFKECGEIESIVLPDSLETLGKDAFKDCAALLRIEIGERSELFASHDGMLFDKELAELLVCPEGKRPVAALPDSMTTFADDAFAGCRNLEAFQVGEGNQAFASIDGVLYSADRTRLVMAPARTVSVIVAPETKVIAAGAFSACPGLASIIANGYVETIEGGAFPLEALSNAMVALASGDDYDARKAVWDGAGFSNFIEPATPGEIQQPEPAQSGFVFELLDDFTLAVSWTGESDPEADLVIPSTAKLNDVEYRVSAIAAGGFQGRQSLSSVQIRAPISAIGDDAFAGCTGLASVELSEGVSAIGAGAFSGTAVQRAVIPASVTSVGSRAFADCPSLSQIITFSNALSVAGDAIVGCTGVSIHAPYNETGEYPWNVGIVASGNSIQPYGVSFSSDPLTIEVDETADLFEGGVREVPGDCELTYSYAATPISVEAGHVTGKKLGVSEVVAVLSLDGIELGRSVRVVEVVAGRPSLYASTIHNRVSLIFDTNGGSAAPRTQNLFPYYTQGTTTVTFTDQSLYFEKPADPVKEGCKFLGWYYKVSGSEFDFSARPVSIVRADMKGSPYQIDEYKTYEVTLVAKWGVAIPEGATGGVIGGTNGSDTVTWYITSDNELVITPTDGVSGTLPSYANSSFPWRDNTTITKATIEGDVKAGKSVAYLFYGCLNLASVDGLQSLDTSNATNMSGMFYSCRALQSLDVSKFDTSNVTDMHSMFIDCRTLASVDLSGFITTKVTDMSGMFNGCSALQSLGVSHFDTSKVTDMSGMFGGCSALQSLDVSKFVTSNVANMSGMFNGCAALQSLDVSKFVTSNVTRMDVMFQNCNALQSLDVSNFATSNVTNMYGVFNKCNALQSLDVSNFDTSNVTNMGSMFNGCATLQSLDVSKFATSNVTRMDAMFYKCNALQSLNLSGFDTSNVTRMDSMFNGCNALQSLGVSHFDTSNVTRMDSMFDNCSVLTSLDVSKFVTSNVANMSNMFSGCKALKSLDVSGFVTSKVTSMGGMFSGCKALQSLNLSGFVTSNVTDMSRMFNGCAALQSLDVLTFDTSNVKNMSFMFDNCSVLTTLDVSKFVTSNVTNMSYMFSDCKALQSLNLSGFDTSKVTNMSRMFNGCKALRSLDVSSFNTSNVKNMASMFGGCRALQSLDVSTFKTPNVTEMSYMFNACTSLKTLDVTMLETSNVTDMSGMFYECSALQSLDLSKFDTSKVTDMAYMFRFCPGLSFLDLSNFNTTNVVKSDGMFGDCSALIEVKVGTGYSLKFLAQPTPGYSGNWTNSSGTSYAYDAIPSGVADTYKAELATYAITYETNGGTVPNDAPTSYTIKSADIALPTPSLAGSEFLGWYESADFSGDPVTTIASGSSGDKTFYAKWNQSIPSDVKDSGEMGGVTWYITADNGLVLTPTNGVEGTMDEITTAQPAPWIDWKPSVLSLTVETGVKAGKSLSGSFSDCVNLTSVDISGLDTSNTENMSFMFASCMKLQSLDLSRLDTSKVTDMYALFSHCESMTEVNLSGLNTSKVIYMHRMFNECHSLKALDLSGFITSSIRDMDHMFYNCVSLESLDMSGWTIANVDADMGNMFENCTSLPSLDVSTWTVSGAVGMYATFKGCASIASLDLSSWDTSKATNAVSTFEGCSNLADVKLPNGFVSATVTDASKLFFDCPKLTTIPANLAFPESVTATQVFGFTEAPSEFVATTYAGEDPRLHSYDWISDCRLLNDSVQVSGVLPTEYDSNDGRWELSADGTLRVWCERFGAVIQDFGWETSGSTVECWSPLRANVKKVIVDESVDAVNMAYWFSDMPSLADIEGVYIPSSVSSARGLFQGSGISKVPEGFALPEGMTDANRMFRNCKNLIAMPRTFKLSSTISDAANMFDGCSSLRTLPDEFTMPERMTSCSAMFLGCSSLESLPSGLRLPRTIEDEADFNNMFSGCSSLKALPEGLMQDCDETVTNLNGMFLGCSSLSSLPERFMLPSSTSLMHGLFANCSSLVALPNGFAMPTGVTSLGEMFDGCTSLRYVPASFNFTSLPAEMRTQDVLRSAFGHEGDTIETYYGGADLSSLAPEGADAVQYWLSAYNRALVSDVPEGSHLVSFKIPDGNGVYGEPFATALSNAEDKIANIEAPTREGAVFVGWYIDEACTQPFDFAKTVAEQTLTYGVLFGRYEKTSTTLPTVGGGEHASWELTQDGTLYISCEDGYTIADLNWEPATSKTDYWGPMRSKVKRVQMHANVKAESMACWFMSMTDLTDVSGVFVPEGVTNVSALFSGCSSLTGLPEGFVIPEGVWNLDGMMNSTPKLEGLPDGFHLPESAEIVAGMFESSGIQSLPAGFTITKNVTDTRWMFQSCHQLTELPEGFQLPMDGKLEKAKNMFNMATGLKSIPVGYKIPASVTDCSYMFGSCRALTTIPEGFTLPSKGDLMAEYLFQSCNSLSVIPASLSLKGLMDAGWDPDTQGKEMFMVYSNQSPVISTLYMGKASDMPETAWWKKQRRTLYFADDPVNPLPSGMKTVTFKTASLTTPGQWDDFATVLTDENGKLTQPGDPQAFGYPFKGWYTSEACMTKFDFGKQITADDVVVYGAFGAPILRGTVPLEVNVVVDNAGGSTTAPAEIRSFTPVDIDLTSVACETGLGIAEMFPDEADRSKPFATVTFPDLAEPVKASFTGQPAATSVTIPRSTGWTSPGTKGCDISLDLNGAQVKHRIEDYAAQVANIVWTVEVKK